VRSLSTPALPIRHTTSIAPGLRGTSDVPEREVTVRGPGANLKTQYAVQAVLYLARRDRQSVAPVSEISAELGISAKFLEDVLAALRAAGIVLSRRGKDGGYQLGPEPGTLTVLDVVKALEGPMDPPLEDESSAIIRATARTFGGAWAAAAGYLERVTIQELVESSRNLETKDTAPYMYHL
jgi:Rrf2 family protein